MVSFVKFQPFVLALGTKLIDLNGDTLKVALTNTAPTAATDDELADITQVANGNGYTTGGTAAASNAYSQTGGVGKLTANDVVFTGSGAGFGPFRYAVLYSDTSTNDKLIGYWDYASSISLGAGDTFTVDFDSGTGILTIT
jgi:hypothetical protein